MVTKGVEEMGQTGLELWMLWTFAPSQPQGYKVQTLRVLA